jgi:hypothetical protein
MREESSRKRSLGIVMDFLGIGIIDLSKFVKTLLVVIFIYHKIKSSSTSLSYSFFLLFFQE